MIDSDMDRILNETQKKLEEKFNTSFKRTINAHKDKYHNYYFIYNEYLDIEVCVAYSTNCGIIQKDFLRIDIQNENKHKIEEIDVRPLNAVETCVNYIMENV